MITKDGQSLGQLVKTNKVPLAIDGIIIDPMQDNNKYGWIMMALNQVKSCTVDEKRSLDVSSLYHSARLNGLPDLTVQPPLMVQAQPWYKKYRSHITLGITTLCIGSFLTVADANRGHAWGKTCK